MRRCAELKMDVQEKLKEWGFEELAHKFTENGMEIEVLKICNFEDISTLLSPLSLGSKIIFKKKLEEFQKGVAWVEIYSEVACDGENAITVPLCSKEYSPYTTSTSEVISETPIAIGSTATASFPEVTRKYSQKRILKDMSGVTESPNKRARKSKLCHEVIDNNLKENVLGRSIISFYEKKGYLDKSNRNKLAKLILSLELEDDLEKSITTKRFLQLREAIVKIFPTETKETWFKPFQNLGNGRKSNAKGKLVELYHNNRKYLIKSGIITKRGLTRNSSPSDHDDSIDESSKEVTVCKLEPEDLERDDEVKVLTVNANTPKTVAIPPPFTPTSSSKPASKKKFNPRIKTRDEFDVFGEYIASQLRKCTDLHNVAVAKHKINQILFEVERSNLKRQSKQNLPSHSENSRTCAKVSTEPSNSKIYYSTEDDSSFDVSYPEND